MKRNLLIIGGIAASLMLACIAGWMIYAPANRSGVDETVHDSRSLSASYAVSRPVFQDALALLAVEAPPAQPSDYSAPEIPEAPPAQPSDHDAPGIAHAAERLIIQTGNISMVVEDTRAAQAAIKAWVERMAVDGAFMVSADEYGGTEGSQPHVTMTIRVPASRFDETMDRLAEMAVTVISRNESAQDVTEEYVDLEARLESLEAARQRLLEIVQEAQATKDLLEAERQLTQREAEIESLKGRMQYLDQSARLSSIWIELQPYILRQPVADEWHPAETARRALETLVDGLRGFGDFAIFFSIAFLPWLAAIGLVIFVVVLLVRWRARVRRDRQTGPASA